MYITYIYNIQYNWETPNLSIHAPFPFGNYNFVLYVYSITFLNVHFVSVMSCIRIYKDE